MKTLRENHEYAVSLLRNLTPWRGMVSCAGLYDGRIKSGRQVQKPGIQVTEKQGEGLF